MSVADIVGPDAEIVTDYVRIDQERVDAFARATDDLQWIHTDPVRAGSESPFGSTVVHGFLLIALLPKLLSGLPRPEAARLRVNAGFNYVRFLSPVPTGAEIRVRAKLLGTRAVRGGLERTWEITVERRRTPIPACVAEWIIRYYP